MNHIELENSVKDVKREYYREYRRKNKARIAENNKRYWVRKAEKKLKADGANQN